MDDPIRLYLDEDALNRSLVRALRSRAFDLTTAHEAGLGCASDWKHLDYAASQGCAVFTHNVRDFAVLHRQWQSADSHHAGIIVADQAPVGVLLRRLLKLLNACSAGDIRDQLIFLSMWR
jgi:hypothetical protein